MGEEAKYHPGPQRSEEIMDKEANQGEGEWVIIPHRDD